jgi:hypothetical protein
MSRMKNSFILLILIMLISGSCKNSLKNDHSLTVKEYEKMGMPDLKKLWSSKAYTQVFAVLSKVKMNDPLTYPRKNSRKSGDVFSRFINKENLSFLNDPTISLRDKAFEMQSFSSVQNTLTQKYTDDFRVEQYYNVELIETYIFGLYVHEKMLDLAGEIMNSNDDYLSNMKAGIKIVLNGYVQMTIFMMGEQVKSNVYQIKDLEKLSTEVSHSLIKNMKSIEPENRQKIAPHLNDVIEKSPSDYIKKNYQQVLKMLNDTNLK